MIFSALCVDYRLPEEINVSVGEWTLRYCSNVVLLE